MSGLAYELGSKTIQEFLHLYNNGQLNLEPGFQRRSVWLRKDRQALIESIYTNRPIPSIFLYKKSDEKGRLQYDVIDGKQRLESVLAFIGAKGFKGARFSLKLQLPGEDQAGDQNWTSLKRRKHEHTLMSYKVATVEVAGGLSEIIDLFVRINSTGKHLSTAEKRHARYYNSPFLRRAGQLAERKRHYLAENGVMTPAQFSRMKHVELVSELLASLVNAGPINKKQALDSIIGGQGVAAAKLARATEAFTRTLNQLSKIFPDLCETRFRNSVEFYSLFMLTWELDSHGAILTDAKRNREAQELLRRLSSGVDEVRSRVRKAEGARPDQRIFADYLLTVQGDTDSQATRIQRAKLLRAMLGGIFEKKDERRIFTAEQRRLIWNSDEQRKCSVCDIKLTWQNFTVDHVKPHSKGGLTSRANAALACKSCNSKKGNRSSPARKRV
jgi:hypothetical protein